MNEEIMSYNEKQTFPENEVCNKLASIINEEITQVDTSARSVQAKIWHAHPVWFIDGNPIVGYSKQKPGIRLMFWSGADFEELGLNVRGKKFKDASVFYKDVSEINIPDLKRWLKKSKVIQWDYKNLIKRKGKLERLK